MNKLPLYELETVDFELQLADCIARHRTGAARPGELIRCDGWPHRILAEEVPNPGEIVFSANCHYWRSPEYSVPVLQLSYDDEAGRFPWVSGYQDPLLQTRRGNFRA